MINYLARLYLLHGVPFNYLVPDPRMLPEESIRFFLLDRSWLNALIDGAMSIGRVTRNDADHDDSVKQLVLEEAAKQAATIREQALARAGAPGAAALPTDRAAHPTADAHPTWSGFLLRSALVAGWPGLEVEAYQDTNETIKLNILRMERLSTTVLLCIFDGVFQQLNLHEPNEGIQFGAEYDAAAERNRGPNPVYFKEILRGLGFNGQSTPPPGGRVPVSKIPVPTRDDVHRVVRLADFAAALPSHLKTAGIQTPATLTAAEFSVEMVEPPYLQKFVNNPAVPHVRALAARTFTAEVLAPSADAFAAEGSETAGIQTPATLTAAEFSVEMVEPPTAEASAAGLAADRERLAAYLYGESNQ